MPFVTTKDKTEIFYKDWGNPSGKPVVFSHGWPLNSDNWENQMFFLGSHGYRVIAHDRRGHGRSSQPWDGNDMDTYADDLLTVIEHLDLKDAMLVGHSTGGGEVARFLGRHGSSRVSKAVLVGAVPPCMVLKESNPNGLPISVFDGFRTAMTTDRAQFFLDVPTGPFFGFNLPGAKSSQGLIQSWWQQGMLCGFKGAYDCIKAFSETDFTEDLKSIDIPVLLLHGEADQIVPIKAAALESIKLLKKGTLKIYPGGAHALPNTAIDEVNEDLLKFLQS
ncbi:Alpha/beta hydrolase protein [Hyaloscypha variabilis F]|uniref:Alpha/beta hydrolase protein n=1 Tax=Hyaloscypha variabilis (strain UAMH 11265 / GT02V1 / F) TaxID=1149755 RepID=A0A2J6R3Y0_HYAVF|nr:Alpha/beta hydrolase protein [Hyaloscypha variabilis F]